MARNGMETVMKSRRMQIHLGFFQPPPLMGFEQLCSRTGEEHSAAFLLFFAAARRDF